MNKLLMEENDRLQKQVSQLVYDNGYMRQQLQNVSPPNKNACNLIIAVVVVVIIILATSYFYFYHYC